MGSDERLDTKRSRNPRPIRTEALETVDWQGASNRALGQSGGPDCAQLKREVAL